MNICYECRENFLEEAIICTQCKIIYCHFCKITNNHFFHTKKFERVLVEGGMKIIKTQL